MGFSPTSFIDHLLPVCTPPRLYSPDLCLHHFSPVVPRLLIHDPLDGGYKPCAMSHFQHAAQSAVVPRLSAHFMYMDHVKCMYARLGRSRPDSEHRIL